jgi:hypothetical protein
MHSGGRLTAETYIVRPEYVDCLKEAEWDFSEFFSSGKSKFRLCSTVIGTFQRFYTSKLLKLLKPTLFFGPSG